MLPSLFRQRAIVLLLAFPSSGTSALSYFSGHLSSPIRCAVSLTRRAMSSDAPACAPGAAGKCVPCESLDKSHLLTRDQIESELVDNLKMWNAKDTTGDTDAIGAISRSYTARNFQAALDSINAIGKIAERENHHPDIHLTGYRNVEIVLFTHSLGGISLNDIELAKMMDAEVEVDYSPKWLKSNPEAKREG